MAGKVSCERWHDGTTGASRGARVLATPKSRVYPTLPDRARSAEERPHERLWIEWKQVANFSPTPTNRTGTPSACSIAKTIPPFAVELSFVRMIPVRPVGHGRPSPGPGRSVPWSRRGRTGPPAAPPEAAIDHAAHLRQLVHQVRLGVKPPGGVGDQHVHASGDRRVDGVVHHGRRVGARGVRHDLRACPVTPGPQLLDGRGPKCAPAANSTSGPRRDSARRASRSWSSCRSR